MLYVYYDTLSNMPIDILNKYSVFDDNLQFKYDISANLKNLQKTLNSSINRCEVVMQIDEHIQNIKQSNKLEMGIFEYTIFTIFTNNYSETLLNVIYFDKVKNIISNFEKNTTTYNENIFIKIRDEEFDCQDIAFMEAYEIFPENWEIIIKKKKLKEIKKNNTAVTNLYTCPNCGERKCTAYELQIRSADEPMTTFVDCLVCLHRFNFN